LHPPMELKMDQVHLQVKATLSKSILDLLSGREFGTGPNSLSLNQSLA
jgi:hypothetical protein